MKYEKLVSIILPCYNSDKYIVDAVESVIDQIYQNWELLIVNDGSTDRTEDKILQFKDPRIRYFKQKNQGVSSARNLALSEMRGELFCFLDSDDKLSKDSLLNRVIKFEDPSISFVDGIVNTWDVTMKNLTSVFIPTYVGNPLKELLMLKSSCFYGITWMIRTNEKIYFDTEFTNCEDLNFFIEQSINGGNYCFVNTPIYERRSVSNSASSNLDLLGKGYLKLYIRIKKLEVLSRFELIQLKFKIKKIMFLSFLSVRELGNAITYLFR